MTGCFAAYFLKKDFNVTLFEKAPALGGLCRTDYTLEGIPFQKGAHVLATDDQWIVDIFKQVLFLQPVDYRVAIDPLFDFRYYNFPFDQEALGMMPWHWKEAIRLDLEKINGENAYNLEDITKNFFGETIYNIFYSGLFHKIFGKKLADIRDIDWARKEFKPIESVVRYFSETTYFPVNEGYNKLFSFLTNGIRLLLNTTATMDNIPQDGIIICTGRPDLFFLGKEMLKYTKLSFDVDSTHYLPNKPDTIFYPNHTPFISITQFGKFYPKYNKNIIVKDIPQGEEEAFPVHDRKSIETMKKIKAAFPGAYLLGRIGSFQILTMAECIKQVARICAEIKHKEK